MMKINKKTFLPKGTKDSIRGTTQIHFSVAGKAL